MIFLIFNLINATLVTWDMKQIIKNLPKQQTKHLEKVSKCNLATIAFIAVGP